VPIEILVLVCIVVGIFPQWSIGPALDVAARPVVGGAMPPFSLAIWHGFNKPLVMSLIALGGGIALYLLLRRGVVAGRFKHAPLLGLNGQRLFESTLYGLDRASRWALAVLSTYRLQPQMLLMVLAAIVFASVALWAGGISWGDRPRVPGNLEFALLWVLGCVAALAAANQAKFHRLAALILLGAVGLAVSLTFLWFSAPDLALTQLTVEVVTTVLFLLGLRWLPKRRPEEAEHLGLRVRARRARDFVVSLVAGGGMAVLA